MGVETLKPLEDAMRFMILLKADADSEAGVMPDEALLTAMTQYNEELVKAGVMRAGEGLQSSAKGARVRFSGSARTVKRGRSARRSSCWPASGSSRSARWRRRSTG